MRLRAMQRQDLPDFEPNLSSSVASWLRGAWTSSVVRNLVNSDFGGGELYDDEVSGCSRSTLNELISKLESISSDPVIAQIARLLSRW